MRVALLAMLVVSSLAASAVAQGAGPSPYSKEDFGPPVQPDGSLHWPTFFKSQKFELYYQTLWMTGSCQGTSPHITVPATNNRVDIDQMPEGEISGRVARVGPGTLEIVAGGGLSATVLTHPAGVSRVSVKGDCPAAALQPGMIVRFVGSVNSRGDGEETLSELEIVTVPADYEYPSVEAGESRTITAKVAGLRKQLLMLEVEAGSLRKLRFRLADRAVAHVDGNHLALASVGDMVTAKGRLYSAIEEKKTRNFVFASDVNVEKPTLREAPTAVTARR